jgi:hypothetical protein
MPKRVADWLVKTGTQARDRIVSAVNDLATMASSAILGRQIKKYDHKTGVTTTVRRGGLVQTGPKVVKKYAKDFVTEPARRMGWIKPPEVKVGQTGPPGMVLAEITIGPRGRREERWVREEDYRREMERQARLQEQLTPTAAEVGWQYRQKHRGSPLLPFKAQAGTLLSLDYGNIFGMRAEPQRDIGLAHWMYYEEDPKRVIRSPAVITGALMFGTWGAGKFVARPIISVIGKKTGPRALAKSPFWGAPAIKAPGARITAKTAVGKKLTPAVRRTAPLGATRAQVVIGSMFAPVIGYGVYRSGVAAARAGVPRKEVVQLDDKRMFTVERGGPADIFGEGARQAGFWFFGLRGIAGKPFLPQKVSAKVWSPFYSVAGLKKIPVTPEATAAAKAGQVINVKPRPGETLAQAKTRIFKTYGIKKGQLPKGLQLIDSKGRLVVTAGGKLPSKHNALVTWATPAESPQFYFLKSTGYGDFSLYPVEMSRTGRMALYRTAGMKLYNPYKEGDLIRVVGHRGFAEYIPKHAVGTRAPFLSTQTLKGKAELELILPPGAKMQRVPLRKDPTWQRNLQRIFFGDSQYYYEHPVTGKRILAQYFEPVSAKPFIPRARLQVAVPKEVPAPKATLFSVTPQSILPARASSAAYSPYYSPYYYGTMPYYPSYPRREAVRYKTYPSRDEAPARYPYPYPVRPYPVEAPPPSPAPARPEPGRPKEMPIKTYETPEDYDFYNELKKAYKGMFGEM